MELSGEDFVDGAKGAVSSAKQYLVLGDILSAEPSCPECGGDMAETYVRAPHQQEHWRGVRAEQCEECGYAESLERP